MKTYKHSLGQVAPIGLLIAGLLMTACQTSTTQASSTTGSAQTAAIPVGQVSQNAAPTPLPTRAVATTTSIAADGSLSLTKSLVNVSFDTSGKVTAIYVTPGQSVKKGDVLAEVDTTTLNTAIKEAQQSLELQKAQIAKSLAPAKQTDIDNAKAALNSAYASYNALKAGPSDSAVEQALRNLNQAKNSLYSSQLGRDQTCGLKPGYSSDEDWRKALGDPECKQADMGVQSAEMRVTAANQSYIDAQAPTSQTDLTSSWANVVQAQTSLATLQSGVSDQQEAIYDLQIKQAETKVERAQSALLSAKLLSPCDCVVQSVPLSLGATASSGSPISLLDLSEITFQTTNLNERDVVNMKAGLPASIRLKAFTNTFTGTVDAVLPLSSGTLSTVALYTVILSVDKANADLRPGMTGQAEISITK